jgi:hypothetical protein
MADSAAGPAAPLRYSRFHFYASRCNKSSAVNFESFSGTPSTENMSSDPKPRPDKGSAKMPDLGNMLPMFIQEWEAVFIGKKLVKEDAEDDENVSLLL